MSSNSRDKLRQAKKLSEVLRLLSNGKFKPAVLVGNGIVLNSGMGVSWGDLLWEIATKLKVDESRLNLLFNEDSNSRDEAVKEFAQGVTGPDIFDWLNGAEEIKDVAIWKGEVSSILKEKGFSGLPTDPFWKLVKNGQHPVMTTNFDLMPSDLRMFKMPSSSAAKSIKHSHHYPWDEYYAQYELDPKNIKSSFALWHIHGRIDKKSSIRLGLTDYMGAVAKARRVILPFNGNHFPKFATNTWLDVFYKCPIVIVGLNLAEGEVFIRWLLLRRYASQNWQLKADAPSVVFLRKKKDDCRSVDGGALVEALGGCIVEVECYCDCYE